MSFAVPLALTAWLACAAPTPLAGEVAAPPPAARGGPSARAGGHPDRLPVAVMKAWGYARDDASECVEDLEDDELFGTAHPDALAAAAFGAGPRRRAESPPALPGLPGPPPHFLLCSRLNC